MTETLKNKIKKQTYFKQALTHLAQKRQTTNNDLADYIECVFLYIAISTKCHPVFPLLIRNDPAYPHD